MNTYRNTARVVGGIYLAAMVVYGGGNVLIQSILGAPNPLSAVSANTMLLAIGASLMLINSAIVVGHGIMMLPVLKPHNERMAFGYLGSRIVESAILAVGVVFLLLQIPLGREYLKAEASDASYLQALSTLSIEANLNSYEIGMIAVGFAGLMLCYMSYRAKLVPWLVSVWGLVGYASLPSGAVLGVLGFDLSLIHTIPGGLWEMFIGVWLIVKGFDSPAIVSESDNLDDGSWTGVRQPVVASQQGAGNGLRLGRT